jgi:hypothetical protein
MQGVTNNSKTSSPLDPATAVLGQGRVTDQDRKTIVPTRLHASLRLQLFRRITG